MSKIKINLVGAGRVGRTLLGLLSAIPECSIQDILSARFASAQEAVEAAGAGRAVEFHADMRPADLWIVAVPDSRISIAAAEIANAFKGLPVEGRTPVVFHCSGFFAAGQMQPLRALEWHLASVHPVLTFADPETAIEKFRGTYCGIEGDGPALDLIQPILEKLGAHPFPIRSESKSLYHAAAVISNNFTVVLQAIAREAWAAAGVPDEVARHLNDTLLRATCENLAALGPQDALTGPAARGDDVVVARQGEDVTRWHPAAGALYRDLSAMAKQLKNKGETLENQA